MPATTPREMLSVESELELLTAASEGRLSDLGRLLHKGVDANTPLAIALSSAGFSAFHHACLQGHADCVEMLMRAGCSTDRVSASGKTGPNLAAQQGHTGVLIRIAAIKKAATAAAATAAPPSQTKKKNQRRRRNKKANQTKEVDTSTTGSLPSSRPCSPAESPVRPSSSSAQSAKRETEPDHDATVNCEPAAPRRTWASLAFGTTQPPAAPTEQETTPAPQPQPETETEPARSPEHEPALAPAREPALKVEPEMTPESEPETAETEHEQPVQLLSVEDTECLRTQLSRRGRKRTDSSNIADLGAVRQLTDVGWMVEWTEAQVITWTSLIELPPSTGVDVVSLVEAAFSADGGGIDGEELAELRERILQRMLRRVGVQEPAGLAEAILRQRDAVLEEADAQLQAQFVR